MIILMSRISNSVGYHVTGDVTGDGTSGSAQSSLATHSFASVSGGADFIYARSPRALAFAHSHHIHRISSNTPRWPIERLNDLLACSSCVQLAKAHVRNCARTPTFIQLNFDIELSFIMCGKSITAYHHYHIVIVTERICTNTFRAEIRLCSYRVVSFRTFEYK